MVCIFCPRDVRASTPLFAMRVDVGEGKGKGNAGKSVSLGM